MAIADALQYVTARESLLAARKRRTLGQENLPARAERLQILVERRDSGLAAQFINDNRGAIGGLAKLADTNNLKVRWRPSTARLAPQISIARLMR